jgi:hypothetical protein
MIDPLTRFPAGYGRGNFGDEFPAPLAIQVNWPCVEAVLSDSSNATVRSGRIDFIRPDRPSKRTEPENVMGEPRRSVTLPASKAGLAVCRRGFRGEIHAGAPGIVAALADVDPRERRVSAKFFACMERAVGAARSLARFFALAMKLANHESTASSSQRFDPLPPVSSGSTKRPAFNSAKIQDRLRGSFSAWIWRSVINLFVMIYPRSRGAASSSTVDDFAVQLRSVSKVVQLV